VGLKQLRRHGVAEGMHFRYRKPLFRKPCFMQIRRVFYIDVVCLKVSLP
jgi:hypothetical protein